MTTPATDHASALVRKLEWPRDARLATTVHLEDCSVPVILALVRAAINSSCRRCAICLTEEAGPTGNSCPGGKTDTTGARGAARIQTGKAPACGPRPGPCFRSRVALLREMAHRKHIMQNRCMRSSRGCTWNEVTKRSGAAGHRAVPAPVRHVGSSRAA